jgi:DNA-binding NarL/FixJ family response regulator
LLDANTSEAADLRAKLADSRHVSFSVCTAASLDQGLQLLAKQNFDVVLVDPNSTESTGAAILAELRTLAPETSIIAVTANHSESEALEIVRAGAQDYLVKSRLNSAAIERILLYCMERQRALRRSAAQYAVSRVLTESGTLEAAETGLLRVLCESCGCERGHFWEFDHWAGDLALTRAGRVSAPMKPKASDGKGYAWVKDCRAWPGRAVRRNGLTISVSARKRLSAKPRLAQAFSAPWHFR